MFSLGNILGGTTIILFNQNDSMIQTGLKPGTQGDKVDIRADVIQPGKAKIDINAKVVDEDELT